VHNSNFKAIHSANLYPASGASDDWYIGALGSRFAYTFELRQGGRYGFDLPLDEIIPSGEELWAAFKTFLKRISEIKRRTRERRPPKTKAFHPLPSINISL
ncbi:Zinc carboxypeptidase A 1like, partial [Caligus rogercresseyi]